MRKIKFLLMLALLLVGISSVAQTAIEVEFVAGVDKGKNVKVDWKGKAGADQVEKDGVDMIQRFQPQATIRMAWVQLR